MFAKPDREKSMSRIDGMQATVVGFQRVIVAENSTIDYTGVRSVR